MKRLTEKIRQAKTWQERVELAKDKKPGTPFDSIFDQARLATKFKTLHPAIAREIFERLGEILVQTIEVGDSQVLHNMADDLNVWKRHKPRPDLILVTLFSLAGLFPPGWHETWGRDRKGNLVSGYTAVPAGTRVKLAMRDIKRDLFRINPKARDEDWNKIRRKVERYAKELGIELDSTPGRPTEKPRHNRH